MGRKKEEQRKGGPFLSHYFLRITHLSLSCSASHDGRAAKTTDVVIRERLAVLVRVVESCHMRFRSRGNKDPPRQDSQTPVFIIAEDAGPVGPQTLFFCSREPMVGALSRAVAILAVRRPGTRPRTAPWMRIAARWGRL